MIFQTPRLLIRRARPEKRDVEVLYSLWTNPEVMKFVGFPKGLRITKEEILSSIEKQDKSSPLDQYLIVERKEDGVLIGECKLGSPDEKGVSETDVKIFPLFWGNKYGVEIKRGLVDYLFTHTDCKAVKATPNRENIPSIKMQEAVGGKRIGEMVWKAPPGSEGYQCDVHSYVYMVYREEFRIIPSPFTEI